MPSRPRWQSVPSARRLTPPTSSPTVDLLPLSTAAAAAAETNAARLLSKAEVQADAEAILAELDVLPARNEPELGLLAVWSGSFRARNYASRIARVKARRRGSRSPMPGAWARPASTSHW